MSTLEFINFKCIEISNLLDSTLLDVEPLSIYYQPDPKIAYESISKDDDSQCVLRVTTNMKK